jgi:pyrroline-5-carboxylate reductase
MKIQFIGCGKMGEAILKGFLKANIPAQDITVQETYQPQAEHIGATYHTHLGIDTDADIVVLAVKPQQIGNVDFAQFPKSALFFSIMAGITIARLEALSGSQNIIRSMPNLPLSVGRGVIGYVKYTDDDQEKTDLLVNAFSQIGKVIRLANEDQIDHISTIS